MPDYVVSTEFAAKDRISGVLTKIDSKVKIFGADAKKSFDKGSRAAEKFGSITGGILKAGAVTAAVGKLKEGVGSLISEYLGFDDAIVSSSAKFKDADASTEAGRQTIEKLRLAARKTGADTEASATQAAQGLDFLAMAGFSADQAMASLSGVVDLSTAGNTDLARSTDIASDSLGAFGLMSKDSAQLQKNLGRQNDVFAATMSSTNTTLEQLFESVTAGAPAFTAAGQSLETFAAFTGVMASAGVKGSESGTKLRNMMLKLSAPSKEAQGVLEDLGIAVADENGNFRDAIDILADFETGLEGMGTQQRTAALSTIFGARTVTGITLLLEKGTDELRKFRAGLKLSAGEMKKMADRMRQSLGNQLKAMTSAAKELGFRILVAFHERGGKGIKSFTEWLRQVDVQPLINALEVGLGLFKGLFNVIGFLSPAFVPLLSVMLAYSVVTKGIVAINAIKHFFTLIKVIRGAAVAQGLLNTVMLANPIGLAVAGVALLIFGLMKLVKYWDKAKGFFSGIGNFFSGKTFEKWEVEEKERQQEQREDKEEEGPQEAPNQQQINAIARSDIRFKGELNIAGAPKGSTFEQDTIGAPAIEIAGMN